MSELESAWIWMHSLAIAGKGLGQGSKEDPPAQKQGYALPKIA